MKSLIKITVRKATLTFLMVLISLALFSQHFSIMADLGCGQAWGEFDDQRFAYSSEMGVGFETPSEIIAFSALFKSESYNFHEEMDLMVFSLPLSCKIYPKINPRPYFSLSLAPSYPTQRLIERYFFLTGGMSAGVSYDFKSLTTFAQFEYLADLTGYNRSDDFLPADEVDKYYLNRYYISFGVKVRLQND
jgi:hypothetical protein